MDSISTNILCGLVGVLLVALNRDKSGNGLLIIILAETAGFIIRGT